jgi:hypothetical protein
MDTLMHPKIDPSTGFVDSRDEPVLERRLVADECDHRAVVVAVQMRVENARARSSERIGDGGDRRRIAPL